MARIGRICVRVVIGLTIAPPPRVALMRVNWPMNYAILRRWTAVMMIVLVGLGGCQTGQLSPPTLVKSGSLYTRGAVAADQRLASQAGAQMLAKGGNAVDAAVAASFTLSVVRPYSCGIGGGGFMVISLPNDPTHGRVLTAINYRETAYVDGDYFERTGKSSTVGGAAVAIPGTVAGLLYALDHYGTLDRATVLAPALHAALRGFIADEHYVANARSLEKQFIDHPDWAGRYPLVWEHFLDEGRVEVGDRVHNPAQYRALLSIMTKGRDGFYGGDVGSAIIDAVHRAGGEMTPEQLMAYQPIEQTPLTRQIDTYTFVTMPPPSSGGVTMLETLMILEAVNYDFASATFTPDKAHILAEALKHAFADRSTYLADPAFIDVPVDDLLDEGVIHERAQLIDDAVHEPGYYGTPNLLPRDAGTSHVSVVDPFGGAVAMTETINLVFGSLVGVDDYGFVLNNEMDDFTTRRGQPNAFGLVQSDRNLPAPGKRPLSSMSPTIVLGKGGSVFAVAGASGGPRIITATMQALLNAMAGMSATDAVAAPRMHHQWLPDVLYAEPGLLEMLRQRAAQGDWNRVEEMDEIGYVQLIVRDPSQRAWQAASDPRKGGHPAGVD